MLRNKDGYFVTTDAPGKTPSLNDIQKMSWSFIRNDYSREQDKMALKTNK